MLLPRLNSPNSPTKMGASTSIAVIQAPSAAKMVEPPVNDIYLCDFCGADFSSLSAIKVIISFFTNEIVLMLALWNRSFFDLNLNFENGTIL